ncbi:MAG: hypothetical protein ACE5KV_09660 [Thermoplasmata archaeon]
MIWTEVGRIGEDIRKNRGSLLFEGKTGHALDDSRRAQRNAFLACIFFLVFLGLLVVLWAVGFLHPVVPAYWVLFFVGISVLIASFLGYALSFGFEIDAIYEEGITNRAATLLDRLRNQFFARFAEIKTIEYGTLATQEGNVDFLRVFGSKGSLLKPFYNRKYRNDFYGVLVQTLKEKCSDCEWLEVKHENSKRH